MSFLPFVLQVTDTLTAQQMRNVDDVTQLIALLILVLVLFAVALLVTRFVPAGPIADNEEDRSGNEDSVIDDTPGDREEEWRLDEPIDNDMPFRSYLEAYGIKTESDLREVIASKSLVDVPGIGTVRARRIRDEVDEIDDRDVLE